MIKICLYVDEFATLTTNQEDEYDEIEEKFKEALPNEDLRFIRDVQPHKMADHNPDIYLMDFGGLCYASPGGSAQASFSDMVVNLAENNPNILFIPYTSMSRDYMQSAKEHLFPGVEMPNLYFPVLEDPSDKWLDTPIVEAVKDWFTPELLKSRKKKIASSTFFAPEDSFLRWIKTYAGNRLVVDVGCGNGVLVRRLKEVGVKVLGIDPLFEYSQENVDLVSCIMTMEAQNTSFVSSPKLPSLFIFCRPCHSGFVEEVISLIPPGFEILYISKPENVEVDLPTFPVMEMPDVPGLNVEKCYNVVKPPEGVSLGRSKN